MTDHPQPNWQDSLQPGDIVAFRFPHKDKSGAAPKTRPTLVLAKAKVADQTFVALAYGTTKIKKRRTAYHIPVTSEEERKVAGLDRPTVFDGARRIVVAAENSNFSVRRDIGSPVIGRLTCGSLHRMFAVSATIRAHQRKRRDQFGRLKLGRPSSHQSRSMLKPEEASHV
ncbi:type II toxin-antitoxin system PemK/MazF family toxin [Actibacterium pelagium]|uniref:PemK-like, MazF-like toxin of type II toxin-antitoxin system n=1 Tax=Actibacterium pelagium TaxID=2029103 RepID=A0A917ANK0_9RHOB|nr:type II toxin-antitoxin system PemK/MazF family toxin [Actibacterium pelagium]GGE62928.1 hypothetical protein GCM10011517_33320 [Actibacterium pelagium]